MKTHNGKPFLRNDTAQLRSTHDSLEKGTDIVNGLPTQQKERQGMTLLIVLAHSSERKHLQCRKKSFSREFSYRSQLVTQPQRRSKTLSPKQHVVLRGRA